MKGCKKIPQKAACSLGDFNTGHLLLASGLSRAVFPLLNLKTDYLSTIGAYPAALNSAKCVDVVPARIGAVMVMRTYLALTIDTL